MGIAELEPRQLQNLMILMCKELRKIGSKMEIATLLTFIDRSQKEGGETRLFPLKMN
jgi:hypothetical protein